MANPHPKIENLKPVYSKWKHKPIKTIRVPEPLADEIISLGLKLDRGELADFGVSNQSNASPDEVAQLRYQLSESRRLAYREARWSAFREAALVNQRDRFQRQADSLRQRLGQLLALDPAEVLNQLRQQYPQSVTTISEIQSLLRICLGQKSKK